jgi:hypothetical protein
MTMILLALAGYLACGFLFAVPFVLAGVKGIDPQAAHGSWAFCILIVPGTIFLWPLLAKRWFSGVGELRLTLKIMKTPRTNSKESNRAQNRRSLTRFLFLQHRVSHERHLPIGQNIPRAIVLNLSTAFPACAWAFSKMM